MSYDGGHVTYDGGHVTYDGGHVTGVKHEMWQTTASGKIMCVIIKIYQKSS